MVFDIGLIKTESNALVKDLSSGERDYKKEAKYLEKIANHVLNLIIKIKRLEINSIYPLKDFCRGLNKCLLVLKEGVEEKPLLKDTARALKNVTTISVAVAENPKKAQEDLGSIGDIRTNLAAVLGSLNVALKNDAAELKDRAKEAALMAA
jgi:hypothetical protein